MYYDPRRAFQFGVFFMKITYYFTFILLICMLLFGCGEKTAGIEGKIIDGQGKPLAGISAIFKQVQPTQGYEQFEAKTGADGSFRLKGIAPSSDYDMTILSDKWNTRISQKIKTPEAGQNLVLGTPIKIRFKQMKDGTVVDSKTGLQWLIYPAADITAVNIMNAVKGINEAGFTDWRLPSRQEIAGLQQDPAGMNKTCCVWVVEVNSEVADWIFYGEENNDLWKSKKESPDNRIVVVRNFIPSSVTAPVSPTAKP